MRAQVLEVLLGAVSVRPGQFAAQRAANCTAVAMAALAGLVPLAKRGRSEGGAADKVAGKVLQLASCMLEDQVGQAAVLPQQTSCVVSQCVSASACQQLSTAAAVGSMAQPGLIASALCAVLALPSPQVYDTCLSRAGAELMAAATCLGSGTLALNQVKAIAEQLLAEAGGLLLRGHSSQAGVVLVCCCMSV